jgi:hypothetical protein
MTRDRCPKCGSAVNGYKCVGVLSTPANACYISCSGCDLATGTYFTQKDAEIAWDLILKDNQND